MSNTIFAAERDSGVEIGIVRQQGYLEVVILNDFDSLTEIVDEAREPRIVQVRESIADEIMILISDSEPEADDGYFIYVDPIRITVERGFEGGVSWGYVQGFTTEIAS